MVTGAKINELTAEIIKSRLNEGFQTGPFFETGPAGTSLSSSARCAAVLVPLVLVDTDWHLLLIRRAETVADHKGQVAFPGGSCETEDDSLEATALRETEEEIGIVPEDVRLLGRLRELVTVSGYIVAPVVGIVKWPSRLLLSKEEVSRVFTIPLVWLSDPTNRETHLMNRLGRDVEVIYYKPYDGEVLWGATARMVKNLIDVLAL